MCICKDNPVYVSTQQVGIYDNGNFQLKSGNEALTLHGILCENGWYVLSEWNISVFLSSILLVSLLMGYNQSKKAVLSQMFHLILEYIALTQCKVHHNVYINFKISLLPYRLELCFQYLALLSIEVQTSQ